MSYESWSYRSVKTYRVSGEGPLTTINLSSAIRATAAGFRASSYVLGPESLDEVGADDTGLVVEPLSVEPVCCDAFRDPEEATEVSFCREAESSFSGCDIGSATLDGSEDTRTGVEIVSASTLAPFVSSRNGF